ncbi:MAG TPA: hypothetical protein EYP32_07915 [Aquificaceae bacterium]|nr:hypothetical protein [Aquificaceae bacterium]
MEALLDPSFRNSPMFAYIEDIQMKKWKSGIKRDRTQYTINLVRDYLRPPLDSLLSKIGYKLSALIDTLDDLVDNVSAFSQEQYLGHLILQELLGFELLKEVSYIDDKDTRRRITNILHDWVYKLVQVPILEKQAIEKMKKGLYDEGVREFYNARVYGTLAHIKLAVEFLPADEKEKMSFKNYFHT